MKGKIAVLLFITIFFASCGNNRDSDTVYIGAILPLTGNASQIGQWQKRGIELAVSEINKKNKKRIKVIFKDSMSSPKNAILAYRNLIQSNNKIKTIISSLTSVSSAIQSSSEKDKKGLIMLAVSHPNITNNRKYSIRFNLGSEDESLYLANYLKKKKYGTLCIAYINNDFGLMASKSLEKNFHNVILKNAYLPTSTDFRGLSEKIINSKCEVINIIGYTSASILLIKQLRELGSKQDIYTNMALSIPSFQKLGGESLKGVGYTSTDFEKEREPKTREFIALYEKSYGKKPTFFASFAYDAINFIYKYKPILTQKEYQFIGSIGRINIEQGKLKTDVSINYFK